MYRVYKKESEGRRWMIRHFMMPQQGWDWLEYDRRVNDAVHAKPYSLVFEELRATPSSNSVLVTWPASPENPEVPDINGYIQSVNGFDFAICPIPIPSIHPPPPLTRCYRAIRRRDTGTTIQIHHFLCLKDAFYYCQSPRNLKDFWKMKKLPEVEAELKVAGTYATLVGYADLSGTNTEDNYAYIQVVDTMEIGLQPLPQFYPTFIGSAQPLPQVQNQIQYLPQQVQQIPLQPSSQPQPQMHQYPVLSPYVPQYA
jgi:hypothetical protein